jgi:hypothetical protein
MDRQRWAAGLGIVHRALLAAGRGCRARTASARMESSDSRRLGRHEGGFVRIENQAPQSMPTGSAAIAALCLADDWQRDAPGRPATADDAHLVVGHRTIARAARVERDPSDPEQFPERVLALTVEQPQPPAHRRAAVTDPNGRPLGVDHISSDRPARGGAAHWADFVDIVDEWGRQSFPASDPPANW